MVSGFLSTPSWMNCLCENRLNCRSSSLSSGNGFAPASISFPSTKFASLHPCTESSVSVHAKLMQRCLRVGVTSRTCNSRSMSNPAQTLATCSCRTFSGPSPISMTRSLQSVSNDSSLKLRCCSTKKYAARLLGSVCSFKMTAHCLL